MSEPREPIVPDPLSEDSRLRSLYMGIDPDNPSKLLWADDDRVRLAREEVRVWHEAHYDSSRDLLEEKHTASLAQGAARVMDQWAFNAPAEFSEQTGYIRQDLETYSKSEAAANPAHQRLAQEIVAWTKVGSPYWDTRHIDHQRYVDAVREKYETLYNSGEDRGRRG